MKKRLLKINKKIISLYLGLMMLLPTMVYAGQITFDKKEITFLVLYFAVFVLFLAGLALITIVIVYEKIFKRKIKKSQLVALALFLLVICAFFADSIL